MYYFVVIVVLQNIIMGIKNAKWEFTVGKVTKIRLADEKFSNCIYP
jgi:hypothetical protein